MPARIGVFVGSLVIAFAIAWFSEPGRRAASFASESYNEVKRVSWPTRKETTQMTGIVFAFVAIMGIFMWVLDKGHRMDSLRPVAGLEIRTANE